MKKDSHKTWEMQVLRCFHTKICLGKAFGRDAGLTLLAKRTRESDSKSDRIAATKLSIVVMKLTRT